MVWNPVSFSDGSELGDSDKTLSLDPAGIVACRDSGQRPSSCRDLSRSFRRHSQFPSRTSVAKSRFAGGRWHSARLVDPPNPFNGPALQDTTTRFSWQEIVDSFVFVIRIGRRAGDRSNRLL
jgi:hypothetical protein